MGYSISTDRDRGREVSEGLFSNEASVIIKLADGKKVSLYTDRELIKEDENGNFLLRVILLKEDEKTVLLPNEAFETSTRWAPVQDLQFYQYLKS